MPIFFPLLILVAVAAFPIWLMVRALNAGVWNQRGVNVYRGERPVSFWIGIIMYGVIAAMIVSFAVYVVWDLLSPR